MTVIDMSMAQNQQTKPIRESELQYGGSFVSLSVGIYNPVQSLVFEGYLKGQDIASISETAKVPE